MRAAVLALLTLAACARPQPYEPPAPSEPVEVEEPRPKCKTDEDVGAYVRVDRVPDYGEGAEVDNQYCRFDDDCYICTATEFDGPEWVEVQCDESA